MEQDGVLCGETDVKRGWDQVGGGEKSDRQHARGDGSVATISANSHYFNGRDGQCVLGNLCLGERATAGAEGDYGYDCGGTPHTFARTGAARRRL